MTIGEKIKLLRTQNNLTQEELANYANTTKQTIHKYETGIITNIPAIKIKAISERLHTSPAYLMGWEDKDENIYKYKNVIPLPKTSKIPLLGEIACGEPIFANENIECDVDLPENIRADFALKCKGDSMIDAHIYDGDIVYIKQQATVNDGEIAAVLIENEATLKRFYKSGDTVTLMPCNTKCQPFVYSGAELENIRILGKAVGFTSTKI